MFEAFSTPGGLDSWWPLKSSGEPVEGTSYSFYFGPEHDWKAKVTHVIKNKSMTWHMTQAMHDWIETEVDLSLKKRGSIHK